MEIVIKARQSGNKSFDFMAFDSPLNPYYKFLLAAIKNSEYTPGGECEDADESKQGDDQSDSDSDDNYLHPSLLGSKHQPSIIPSIPRGLNESDVYSQLVENLKDKIPNDIENDAAASSPYSANGFQQPEQENSSTSSTPLYHHTGSILPRPPPDIEKIIEKLAQRVSQNGEDFELTIKRRGDERFEFLNPGSSYHAHYIRRKLYHLEEKRKTAMANARLRSPSNSSGAVSFSLAFREKKKYVPRDEDFEDRPNEATEKSISRDDGRLDTQEALANKLAAAAKDGLSREKKLQEERKRRAALFLSMVKSKEAQQTNPEEPVTGPSLPKLNSLPVLKGSSLTNPAETLETSKLKKSAALVPFLTRDEQFTDHSKGERRESHKNRTHKSKDASVRSKRDRSRSRSPAERSSSTRQRRRSRSPHRSRYT